MSKGGRNKNVRSYREIWRKLTRDQPIDTPQFLCNFKKHLVQVYCSYRGTFRTDQSVPSFRERELSKTDETDVEVEKEVAVSGRRSFTPTNYNSRRCYAPPWKHSRLEGTAANEKNLHGIANRSGTPGWEWRTGGRWRGWRRPSRRIRSVREETPILFPPLLSLWSRFNVFGYRPSAARR